MNSSQVLWVGLGVSLGACGAVKDPGDATVVISPSTPVTTDDLSAMVTGGPSAPTFRWSANGVVRADATTSTVGAALTTKHELWTVEVLSGSEVIATDEVTIDNSPPTAPAIALPTTSIAGGPIQCTITTPATDADGDAITNTASWT